MKKVITAILALTLALTLLAACGGSPAPSSIPSPTPTQTQDTPQSQDPPPSAPDNSGDDTGGSNVNIPDNGTPPDAPPPFETHPGDKGYFYTTSDDWMIIMVPTSAEVANDSWFFQGEYSIEYGVLTMYMLINWGGSGNDFEKFVHESNAHAEAYAARTDGYGGITVVVDNVTYREIFPQPSTPETEKMNNIREFHREVTNWDGSLLYLSMPEGYEEFLVRVPGASDGSTIEVVQFGGYDWLVLDAQGGEALIISKDVLETRAYHVDPGDMTWEHSSIREYLNGEFLESFSESDRARIIEKTVINDDNPEYGTPGGNDTTDRVFLLSIDEAKHYFTNDSARIALDADGNNVQWRLRSPGNDSNVAAFVGVVGNVYVPGEPVGWDFGVRPAMWITQP